MLLSIIGKGGVKEETDRIVKRKYRIININMLEKEK